MNQTTYLTMNQKILLELGSNLVKFKRCKWYEFKKKLEISRDIDYILVVYPSIRILYESELVP